LEIKILFLVLGHHEDLLCQGVYRGLLDRGFKARIITEIFGDSAKSALRLSATETSLHLELCDGVKLTDQDICGVFVTGVSQSLQMRAGSSNGIYSAEKNAAFLGWIWSLSCPVINRYRPEFWFDRPESIEFWRGRLEPFGLERVGSAGAGRDVCGRDAAKSSRGHLVAAIGSKVVWDEEGAQERFQPLTDALTRFTASLGLEYLEFRLDDSSGRPSVTEIELFPKSAEFCQSSRQQIVDELVALLTSGLDLSTRTVSDSWF
jgi:hypothetical protein